MINMIARGIHTPPPQTLPQLRTALQHEWQNIDNMLYNVSLLPCIAIDKLSSWLMVFITDSDIFPTPISYTCLCTCFRWISTDTVLDMYRVISFPWRLDLRLLVLCLPVLLLNFENQCEVSFFQEYYQWNHVCMYACTSVCMY